MRSGKLYRDAVVTDRLTLTRARGAPTDSDLCVTGAQVEPDRMLDNKRRKPVTTV
jgi:hypothetical protein